MRKACALTAETMAKTRDAVKPGVSTFELGEIARDYIESKDGVAAFLGYSGFPGAICASVNEEVVHGIPRKDRILEEGDIVKLDIGTFKYGFYGDMARTYQVGEITEEAAALMKATETSLYEGIKMAVNGARVGDIGFAIQSYCEERGYGVVRSLVGHGIGRNLHEEPQVPNFGRASTGAKLKSGMVLAIEPMVNAGTWKVRTLDDDWTVVSADQSLSAHFENSILVCDGRAEILTLMDGESEWEKTIQ